MSKVYCRDGSVLLLDGLYVGTGSSLIMFRVRYQGGVMSQAGHKSGLVPCVICHG